jgi:hypothetical protein
VAPTHSAGTRIASSVQIFVRAVGAQERKTIRCSVKDAATSALRFSGEAATVPGSKESITSTPTSVTAHVETRTPLSDNSYFTATLVGVADRDNTVPRRLGIVVCSDITPVSGTELSDKLDDISLTIRVINTRFPVHTHASIHRGSDNKHTAAVKATELTTVGQQNVTLFQRDPSWKGASFFPGEVELRLFHNKSAEHLSSLAAATTPSAVSSDGRSATFMLPPFHAVCQDRQKALHHHGGLGVQCPGRAWVFLSDTITRGTYRSRVYYTEKCHDTMAWPDPTTESHICLSYDPEVASQCSYGSGATCQDCPPHARCPGGPRAWPMPGYWSRNETSVNVVRCAVPSLERCPVGFDSHNLTCPCGGGYAGFACGGCAEGYFQDRDQRCSRCPKVVSWYDSIVVPLILILVFLASVVMGLTTLTLIVIFAGIALANPEKCRLACGKGNLRKWTRVAFYNAFLFGLSLVSLLQVVSSVMRPVPLSSPSWYAATISVLDVLFLDTSGFVSTECLRPDDVFASERRVLVGTLGCFVIVLALQVKALRPENLCVCLGCVGETKEAVCRSAMRSKVTPGVRMVGYYAINLLYGVAASTTLAMVTCVRGVGSDVSRLRIRPDLKCYSAEDGTLALSVLSWVLLILFIIPWPIASAIWVRRNYWKEARGRSVQKAAQKVVVYDYWVADDNHLLPAFYWIRSLDSAVLTTTAGLSAVFGKTESLLEQSALWVTTSIILLSFIALILRLQPYARSRLWARNFRISTLALAILAASLRFCDSDAVGAVESQIEVLAGIFLVLMIGAVVAALVEFERSMLLSTRLIVEQAAAREQSHKDLLSRIASIGISMDAREDLDFIARVRASFEMSGRNDAFALEATTDEARTRSANTLGLVEVALNPIARSQHEVDRERSNRSGGDAGDGVWSSEYDDTTGMPYYFNALTGVSQWERPPGYSVEKSLNVVDYASSAAASVGGHGMWDEAFDPIPAIARLDRISLTTTMNPLHAEDDELARARKILLRRRSEHSTSGLKVLEKRGNWEVLVEQGTGRTIYYNSRLDDIRFERPKRWVKMLAEQIEKDHEESVGR